MVDVNEIYKSNSDYLKAEDIGSQMWTFTIKTADVKGFDNGDRKIVLNFTEWDKSLPLNATNARAVADLYGGDTDTWPGKQIMLFTMPVDFQGRKVQAIRLRAPAPGGQAPAQPAQPAPQSQGLQSYANASGAQYDENNPPPANGPEDYMRAG